MSSRASPGVTPARVLFPLGLGTALSLMGDAALYTVLPTNIESAGITLAGVGIILAANRAVRLLTNGPTGIAYDRLPRRWLFVPALFLGALSTAIYAATTGFWPLLIGRLLWGTAWSGIWVGGATMILDVTSVRDRGRWTGLYQTWFFLGTTMGSFAGGVFTDLIGYSGAMWAAALATTGGAVAALLLLPETRGARRVPYAAVAAALQPLPLRSNAGLWAAVGLQGINRFAVSGVLSATLALLVQQVSGLPAMLGVATVTGILMSGRSIVSMASAPLCGALSDRYGNRWGVLAWMVGAGVVGLALLAWGGMSGVIGGVLLTSVSSGGMQALATSITGDVVASAQRGRAIGLLHTMGDLGSALGPPFAYGLIPFIGVGGVYALCAALFVVGFVLPLSMPHRSTGSS